MHIDHELGREAFTEGLRVLRDIADGLGDDQLLAASRCRGWTVGDVLVHVHLGLQEVLLGLVTPADGPADTDAATYWRAEVLSNDPAADQVAQVRFVRALGAAHRRPTGVVRHLRPTADGVASAVAALAPGFVRFQGHVLATGNFLATWACELAVHHLDLQRELDLAPPPSAALRIARRTVEALAGGPLPPSWSDDEAVLVGAGRTPLGPARAQEVGALAQHLPALG